MGVGREFFSLNSTGAPHFIEFLLAPIASFYPNKSMRPVAAELHLSRAIVKRWMALDCHGWPLHWALSFAPFGRLCVWSCYLRICRSSRRPGCRCVNLFRARRHAYDTKFLRPMCYSVEITVLCARTEFLAGVVAPRQVLVLLHLPLFTKKRTKQPSTHHHNHGQH